MESIDYYKERLASIQDMFSMTTKHLNRVRAELKEAHDALSQNVSYAEKIQAQIVPAFDQAECVFADHFHFIKQRDGVGGDFIYINQLGDKTIFGLMDCTGHGIPGALLAVMGHNFLNEITFGKKLTEPKDILQKLEQRIHDYFKTQVAENKLRDGMEGAIFTYQKTSKTLKYAQAGRPILLKTNNKWSRIRSNKNSIGGLRYSEFDQDEIQISQGAELCIFSDGVTDQFGGPNDKKFMTKRVLQHLEEFSDESPDKKGQKLVKKLLEWQGNTAQTDDISYLSLRF